MTTVDWKEFDDEDPATWPDVTCGDYLVTVENIKDGFRFVARGSFRRNSLWGEHWERAHKNEKCLVVVAWAEKPAPYRGKNKFF